jgi:hypothetical protein
LAEGGHPVSARRGFVLYLVTLVGALLVMGALGAASLPSAFTTDTSLRVESEPEGAEVHINGERRGTTPLVLSLAPADYTVVIERGDEAYERRVTLRAGERASIYQVLPSVPLTTAADPPAAVVQRAAVTSGALSVTTEPAGGNVTLDGIERGRAPIVIQDLAPGEHRVIVRNRGAESRHTVMVAAGATSAVIVAAGAANSAGGWLSVLGTPIPLQIHEAGRLVGTTASDALMLPVGEHRLVFSDEASGFVANRTITITASETTSVTLEVPRAAVNVNASPWAEVWIDNQPVGETPIGNHLLTIGSHLVELRHPALGTKQVTMAVSLKGPNRLAVNMRDK